LFGDSFKKQLLKESRSVQKRTALFTGLKSKTLAVSATPK